MSKKIVPITRDEIIIKYQVTEGQIGFAVQKRKFPKKIYVNENRQAVYDDVQIESYFRYNPVKKSKRAFPQTREARNKNTIFSSDLPESKQTKINKRMADFNQLAVMFNIQKREREKQNVAAGCRALVNKYKPVKHKVLQIEESHEHTVLREIDVFTQIHDANHRIVI